VATQDGGPQRWIGDQRQQLVGSRLDREVVGQLDRQAMSRSQWGDGLLAADGRAGQDTAELDSWPGGSADPGTCRLHYGL